MMFLTARLNIYNNSVIGIAIPYISIDNETYKKLVIKSREKKTFASQATLGDSGTREIFIKVRDILNRSNGQFQNR